jgi:hypothetical protein
LVHALRKTYRAIRLDPARTRGTRGRFPQVSRRDARWCWVGINGLSVVMLVSGCGPTMATMNVQTHLAKAGQCEVVLAKPGIPIIDPVSEFVVCRDEAGRLRFPFGEEQSNIMGLSGTVDAASKVGAINGGL